MSSKCWWEEYAPHRSPSETNNAESAVNQESLTKDVGTRFPVLPPIGLGSPTPTRRREIPNDRQSSCSSVNSEIVRTRTLRGAHLRLTLEAAELLPLAIRSVPFSSYHSYMIINFVGVLLLIIIRSF